MALIAIDRQATIAESRVLSTQKLVSRQMGQGFVADSYASQAERTLANYQSPNKPSAFPTNSTPSPTKRAALAPGQSCHGCGSKSHRFADCPRKDDPAVKEIAKQNYEKFRAARRGNGTATSTTSSKGSKRSRWRQQNPDLQRVSERVSLPIMAALSASV